MDTPNRNNTRRKFFSNTKRNNNSSTRRNGSLLNRFRRVGNNKLTFRFGTAEKGLQAARDKYRNIDDKVMKRLLTSAQELLDQFREGGLFSKSIIYMSASVGALFWIVGFGGLPATGGLLTVVAWIPATALLSYSFNKMNQKEAKQRFKELIVKEVDNVLNELNELDKKDQPAAYKEIIEEKNTKMTELYEKYGTEFPKFKVISPWTLDPM